MSDSKKSSASANVSDSLKDFSTTQEDIPPSLNTSQALPDMFQSLPEGSTFIDLPSESSDEDPPFNLRTLRTTLDDEAAWPARGSFLEVPTDDIPMFSESPTVENQEMMNQYQLTDDFLSQSSDKAASFQKQIPSSEDTSQALRDMSKSSPKYPFLSASTIISDLKDIVASTPLQDDSTDDIPSELSDKDNSSVNIRTLIRMSEDGITAYQENMLDNVEPSQLNQSHWIFVCKFRPAKYLKFAIEALSNPQVSCQGSGRIDIDDDSFNITVLNLSNNVLGHLRLNPARFRCAKPLEGKRLSFLEVSRELAYVEDEGTVYLGIQRWTDQLDIRVLPGTKDIQRFFADLSYTTTAICKFPEDMSFFFTATVPSDDFSNMIDHLLQQPLPPQQVSVVIKDNALTLRAGSDNNPWTADYAMLKDDGSCEMVEGKTYNTTFQWINGGVAESLRRASEMNAAFVVLFHAERPRTIILRFILGDVGYLDLMRHCVP
ncbi:uncharacterized protein LOC141596447 isoform X2 [Silene latifolia]|uniref:uncharacterized protein LOC141596447 isoform X2 n=1 Tax=Silene latifolia TaxID=37657 RepID=UPI003D77F394